LPLDIYSLAHLIYAVVTEKEPHVGKSIAEIVMLTQSGYPLQLEKGLWPAKWIPFMKLCWSVNPAARPIISQIVDIVDC
jgi:hypothetical protein